MTNQQLIRFADAYHHTPKCVSETIWMVAGVVLSIPLGIACSFFIVKFF